jgi:hypothetical protein
VIGIRLANFHLNLQVAARSELLVWVIALDLSDQGECSRKMPDICSRDSLVRSSPSPNQSDRPIAERSQIAAYTYCDKVPLIDF